MAFMATLRSMLALIFKPFKPLYDFIARTIPIWMTLVGIICVVIGGLKFFNIRDDYAKVLEAIGSAILAGGVFGVLLKSFQYSGVFKEELNDVIYGSRHPEKQNNLVEIFKHELQSIISGIEDPEERKNVINVLREVLQDFVFDNKFLANRKDLRELWKRVSIAAYSSSFPDISDKIADRLDDEYFPIKDNFYYSKFEENISIEFIDDEKKYVKAKETIKLKIKPIDCLQPIDWKFGVEIDKDPSDEMTAYELEMLTINKKPIPCRPQLAESPNHKKLIVTLELNLHEGLNEYEVELKHNKTYELDLNQERGVTSGRFINAPELHVYYPARELAAEFVPIGTREEGYVDHANFEKVIWNVYEGLIFPNQGYRLLFRRRH